MAVVDEENGVDVFRGRLRRHVCPIRVSRRATSPSPTSRLNPERDVRPFLLPPSVPLRKPTGTPKRCRAKPRLSTSPHSVSGFPVSTGTIRSSAPTERCRIPRHLHPLSHHLTDPRHSRSPVAHPTGSPRKLRRTKHRHPVRIPRGKGCPFLFPPERPSVTPRASTTRVPRGKGFCFLRRECSPVLLSSSVSSHTPPALPSPAGHPPAPLPPKPWAGMPVCPFCFSPSVPSYKTSFPRESLPHNPVCPPEGPATRPHRHPAPLSHDPTGDRLHPHPLTPSPNTRPHRLPNTSSHKPHNHTHFAP